MKAQFGLIGLGVMGRNLALNIEEKGTPVAVWNYETDWVDRFLKEQNGKSFVGTKSLEELASSLAKPRRILMMIRAGEPVDQTLEKLLPVLEAGDVVIDGGNSRFQDTRRREKQCAGKGIRFFGMGVSGGEEGARHGPSLMPGGDREGYEVLRPVLEGIAAKTNSGPCVTYVGPDGAGHFVKMVHNGIEYADMQSLAEGYDLLARGAGMEPAELADLFEKWNDGPLGSFLVEITAKIFRVRDGETGTPLIDLVLDTAGQKGTGNWTVQEALDLGVPVPGIAAAVDARMVSARKKERVAAAGQIGGPELRPVGKEDRDEWIRSVHDALLASRICAFAQGMNLIRAGSEKYKWGIDLKEIARIWKGGCIIRAKLLDDFMNAYGGDPDLSNLLSDPALASRVQSAQEGWRRAVRGGQQRGIPVPVLGAGLAYFDAYRTSRLPQNLTQAQRDAFGSHTYRRIDRPDADPVHTDWLT